MEQKRGREKKTIDDHRKVTDAQSSQHFVGLFIEHHLLGGATKNSKKSLVFLFFFSFSLAPLTPVRERVTHPLSVRVIVSFVITSCVIQHATFTSVGSFLIQRSTIKGFRPMLLSHRKTLTRIAVVLPSWPASWSRHVARSLPSGIPSIPSIPSIPPAGL